MFQRGVCSFAVLAALLGSLALAGPANANPTSKPYSLTISPGATTYETATGEVASGEAVQITATFTNETATQQMGSANLFPPSGFAVLSSTSFPLSSNPGTASLSSSCSENGVSAGACVQVRNMSAAPGASVTVSMWVTTPACQAGSAFPWTAEVKQANNYSGSPGNDLYFDASNSQPNTTLDGACSLAFGVEPTDTQTGQPISGTAYTPEPSGPALTVKIEDSGGNPIDGNTSLITMGSNPGGVTPGGTTVQSASAGTGTASFGDLTLSAPGTHTLSASSGTLNGATSSSFAINDKVVSCSQGSLDCGTSDGTSNGDQAQVQATPTSSGFLTLSVSFNGAQLVCSAYPQSIDPNTYSSLTPDGWAKSGTITIVPTTNLGNPNKVLKAQQICFGAPYTFATVPGTPLTAGTLPDGSQGYKGLLPDCPGSLNNATGPCHNRGADTTVPDHHSKSGYHVVLAFFIPAGLLGDPHFG